jgi:hypothetical protein
LANTKHAEINDIHDAVSKSLNQIKSENEVAVKLRKQLEHEMVVLEERKAVSCSEDFLFKINKFLKDLLLYFCTNSV